MNIKKATLAATVAAALGLGAVGEASAYVYASSRLEIQNLTILTTDSAGNLIFPSTYNFTGTNTASLNGIPTIQIANCSGTFGGGTTCGPGLPGTPVLDPLVAEIPAGARGGQNNFGYVGTGSQYGSADSVILNAELVNPLTPTHTVQIAENNLLTGKNASSSAELQSATQFVYTFTLPTTANVLLKFDANPDLKAEINDLIATAATAQANMRTNFKLSQDTGGNGVVLWGPRGTLANDCIIAGVVGGACAELVDGGVNPLLDGDLNRQVSVSTVPLSSDVYSYNDGVFLPYALSVTGLTPGTWTLSLDALTSENVTRVPEPATLLLLGAGLAGLGVTRGRRHGRAAT